MPKKLPSHVYAPITGVHEVTEPSHKYSPKYEVRDRNMRKVLATTYEPYTYDVPEGGSVWLIIYNQPEDKFIDKNELNK